MLKIFLCILLSLPVCGQVPVKEKIYHDKSGLKIPASLSMTSSSIATQVNKMFTKDEEKLRALYKWVVFNIAYDTDSMYAINWNKGGEAIITEALRRRKGVCENFAALFTDLARNAGFKSFVVHGYTKFNNYISRSGHSWCAVELNGNWLLCDPTWDTKGDYQYFLVKPDNFIEDHMPFDPLWQLSEHPISHHQFTAGQKTGTSFFNYKDSIEAFIQMTAIQRLENTLGRLDPENKNELIRNRAAFVKMQAGLVYEDMDMVLYNSAVENVNKVVELYNTYLQNQSAAKDATLQPLHTAKILLDNAEGNIALIGKYSPNYQYDTETLQQKIKGLHDKINKLP
ncbi:MAG: transglutaminase domain-containing protein [Ferruginibacter sp.]